MTDEEIIGMLRHKKAKGLDALIDRYGRYICTIIKRIIMPELSEHDAEELAADVFVAVWQNPQGLTADNIRKYLAAAARNKAISRMRTYRSNLPLDSELFVSDDDVEFETEKAITSENLLSALNDMDTDDKMLLIQTYYYCRPLSETAITLGITECAAKTRLFRARKKLKNILEERGITNEN